MEASRNYILNSYLKRNDKHSIIDYSEENKSNEFSRYSFDFIPEGFKLCCVDSDDFSQFLTYTNDKNVSIHITETYADLMTLGVDNEYNQQSELMINNFKAYLFENVKTNGLNILVWNDGNIAFEITSSISGDQLILIAENIIRK